MLFYDDYTWYGVTIFLSETKQKSMLHMSCRMNSTHATEDLRTRLGGLTASLPPICTPPPHTQRGVDLSPQGFALLHNSYRWTTFFQVHFAVGAMINLARCTYVSREKGVGPARGLLKRAMVATALAGLCWMVSVTFVAER